MGLTAASTAPDFHRDSLLIPFDASIGNLTGAKLMVIFLSRFFFPNFFSRKDYFIVRIVFSCQLNIYNNYE